MAHLTAWAVSAFTRVCDALWARRDFAHAVGTEGAPLPIDETLLTSNAPTLQTERANRFVSRNQALIEAVHAGELTSSSGMTSRANSSIDCKASTSETSPKANCPTI